MKPLKRILAVLFSISLCAASVSCARQTGEEPRQARSLTETAWFSYAAPVWPTVPQTDPTDPPEPTTEEPTETTEPTAKKETEKKSTDPLARLEEQALRLTNLEREKEGLAPLAFSEELRRCARIRAVEIVQKFSHDRPDGQSCFSLNPDLIMGENIAYGQTTPRQVVDAWMGSPTHREIILTERFTISAVGCCYNKANDTYYWVQLFG